MPEDGQLLLAYVRRGDLQAFATLVDRHSTWLLAFARGQLASEEDAEDAVQEVWLRLIRFGAGYRGGVFRAYLVRIARSVIVDRYRRRGQPTVSLDESSETGEITEADLADEAPAPDAAFETAMTAAEVRSVVRELPEGPRNVLLLRVEGELTYREIAEQLSIPLGTALTWMRAATICLRRKLGEKT